MNKHRSGTPGPREDQLVDLIRELGRQPGPDRRRSGPHPERIFSCYIKALRSSELGSSFGAYSHHSAVDENYRVVIAQFVEAVTARQAAATCQNSVSRERALKVIDAEIQTFNDRIAEQSCGQ